MDNSVKVKIQEANKIIKNWNEKIIEFTTQIWPSEKKSWKEKKIILKNIIKFQERILEIDQI